MKKHEEQKERWTPSEDSWSEWSSASCEHDEGPSLFFSTIKEALIQHD